MRVEVPFPSLGGHQSEHEYRTAGRPHLTDASTHDRRRTHDARTTTENDAVRIPLSGRHEPNLSSHRRQGWRKTTSPLSRQGRRGLAVARAPFPFGRAMRLCSARVAPAPRRAAVSSLGGGGGRISRRRHLDPTGGPRAAAGSTPLSRDLSFSVDLAVDGRAEHLNEGLDCLHEAHDCQSQLRERDAQISVSLPDGAR